MCITYVSAIHVIHLKHHTCTTCVEHVYYICICHTCNTLKTPHMYYMCSTTSTSVSARHNYVLVILAIQHCWCNNNDNQGTDNPAVQSGINWDTNIWQSICPNQQVKITRSNKWFPVWCHRYGRDFPLALSSVFVSKLHRSVIRSIIIFYNNYFLQYLLEFNWQSTWRGHSSDQNGLAHLLIIFNPCLQAL